MVAPVPPMMFGVQEVTFLILQYFGDFLAVDCCTLRFEGEAMKLR